MDRNQVFFALSLVHLLLCILAIALPMLLVASVIETLQVLLIQTNLNGGAAPEGVQTGQIILGVCFGMQLWALLFSLSSSNIYFRRMRGMPAMNKCNCIRVNTLVSSLLVLTPVLILIFIVSPVVASSPAAICSYIAFVLGFGMFCSECCCAGAQADEENQIAEATKVDAA